MAKHSASLAVVEEAKQAYQNLILVQNHLRAHWKVTKALPKHKIKKYKEIGANLNLRLFNAQNKWDRLIDKLSPKQIGELFGELVV